MPKGMTSERARRSNWAGKQKKKQISGCFVCSQRSEHIIRSRVGDGVRRREQEMDTERQLVRPIQGAALPSPGEQHVPRGRPKAAGSRDRY